MVLMVETDRTSAWMRKKRYFSGSNKQSLLQHDPWQKQTFAEDSSDQLCEFIWPSRCYSCSFCQKEFKSAQALGGHMNVHRRDRARLRQSPSSQSVVNQHPCGSQHSYQHPPGVCSMMILNLKSRRGHSFPQNDPSPQIHGADPTSAVSSETTFCCIDSRKHASSQDNSCQATSVCDPLSRISCGFNLNAAEDLKFRSNLNCNVPWQDLAIGSPDCLLGRKTLNEELLETSDDDDTAKRKRPRSCSTDALALCSRKNAPPDLLHSGLLGRTQSIIEDLDLELRLGVRSKVV